MLYSEMLFKLTVSQPADQAALVPILTFTQTDLPD
jgi:hypothetical protein